MIHRLYRSKTVGDPRGIATGILEFECQRTECTGPDIKVKKDVDRTFPATVAPDFRGSAIGHRQRTTDQIAYLDRGQTNKRVRLNQGNGTGFDFGYRRETTGAGREPVSRRWIGNRRACAFCAWGFPHAFAIALRRQKPVERAATLQQHGRRQKCQNLHANPGQASSCDILILI